MLGPHVRASDSSIYKVLTVRSSQISWLMIIIERVYCSLASLRSSTSQMIQLSSSAPVFTLLTSVLTLPLTNSSTHPEKDEWYGEQTQSTQGPAHNYPSKVSLDKT